MPFRLIVIFSVVMAVLMADFYQSPSNWGVSAAWASDDDDDDGPRRRKPRQRTVWPPLPFFLPAPPGRPTAPSRPAPPPASVQLPDHAPDEIIAHDLTPEALDSLLDMGFTVAQEVFLGSGRAVFRLKKPPSMTLERARDVVRDRAQDADYNHYYRAGGAASCQGNDCLARQMIPWPEIGTGCGAPVRIGMIDTGLNPEHEAFRNAKINVHHIGQETGISGSDLLHGTAVAALLVGNPDSRTPGLVPHAELIAVDAFYKDGRDERAGAFSIIEALDYLTSQGVAVVNMSLAGSHNRALEMQIEHMHQAGIVLVAAAGNGGPAANPAYPAAYLDVIAVTAVDRRGQIYRRAGRGKHIDLAAPGVDVWTAASISGGRNKTGTSFAAPFVTAAAALLLQQQPDLTPSQVQARLQASAHDLGAVGPDEIFGHGLVVPIAPC